MFFMSELPRVVVSRELFRAHAQFGVNPEDATHACLSYPETLL